MKTPIKRANSFKRVVKSAEKWTINTGEWVSFNLPTDPRGQLKLGDSMLRRKEQDNHDQSAMYRLGLSIGSWWPN